MRGSATVHDEAQCTGRSVRGVPLKLDHNESVARKQRWRDLDAATVPGALLAQARHVDLKARQPQEMRASRSCLS